MKRTEAEELLEKYASGNCTNEEIAIIHTWYLSEDIVATDIAALDVEAIKDSIWKTLPVHQDISRKTVKLFPSLLIRRISIAAAVAICFSLGYYFLKKDNLNPNDLTAKHQAIVPGGNKATLTLADGSTIDLNNVGNGVLGQENGTSIVKTDDGKIIYNHDDDAKTVAWNTLSIPAGGYYNITLSDGTIVWLNAKSSLKYPTEFIENNRVVELTGEGYFEVAHRKNQPFKVITQHQTVEVLGTHFNINAYQDEKSITTTLIQGSVKVSVPGIYKILAPNQQAKLIDNNISINPFDGDDAIDWVNNDFIFDNENLGSILRKISRWYNVEVSYPTHLADLEFTGSISRSKNITQVLKIMELTGMVHFKVEGRRITVMQ